MKNTIYCDCSERFEKSDKYLLLQQALYKLQISLLLWLKNFFKTLQDLDLEHVNENIYLYQNSWLVIFFYVNDIVTLCRTADLPKFEQFKKTLMTKYEMRYMNNLH